VKYDHENPRRWAMGDGRWSIRMPITQPVICSVSALMVCLARLFSVEYDGWGSVVQTRV